IADGSTPIRLCARGPSGTLTASTPAALRARHCSSIGVASTPLGGTISTLVTSSPLASFAPQHERADNGTSSTPAGAAIVSRDTTTGWWRGTTLATYSRIFLMCSGVVPQQPPTKQAPPSLIARP